MINDIYHFNFTFHNNSIEFYFHVFICIQFSLLVLKLMLQLIYNCWGKRFVKSFSLCLKNCKHDDKFVKLISREMYLKIFSFNVFKCQFCNTLKIQFFDSVYIINKILIVLMRYSSN